MEKWKYGKMDIGEKRKLDIGKTVLGENKYWEIWIFGIIEIWKNGFSENAM